MKFSPIFSLFVIGLVGFLTSCNTTSSLADGKVFQKRKYTKGYHVNLRKSLKTRESKIVTADAYEEIGRDKSIKLPSFSAEPIERKVEERKLILAAASPEERTQASKKWTSNISLPTLISEVFVKPPQGVVEQPAPAGAIIGFISAIVGLFVAGIPLGLLAVILCSIAIGKIQKNPGMRGRGLAIAGIIIGVIAIVGALIVISNM
ncbi:MAG: hypothetical protein MK086_00080 [Flavobacteriales bacterium]|nr:hypothetical protein [Flavobacteriales bacterium]